MAVKVYVINEFEIVREGIKSILNKSSLFVLVGEDIKGGTIIENIDRAKPNLVCLDINSEDSEIVKTVSYIRRIYPRLFIALFVYGNKVESLYYTVKGLVNAIFAINVKSEELNKGLLEMIRSGFYVQDAIKKLLYEKTAAGRPDRYKINSLTKRELEILVQVAQGMLNKEIATSLNISERTVKNHMSSIFKKIEVSDRTQAAVFAIKNNIIDIGIKSI